MSLSVFRFGQLINENNQSKLVTKMLTSAKSQGQIQNMKSGLVPPCPILLINIKLYNLALLFHVCCLCSTIKLLTTLNFFIEKFSAHPL